MFSSGALRKMKPSILMKTVLMLALLWMADEAAAQQTVKIGERVVLPCPVKVEANNFAVFWSKVTQTGEKTELKLSDESGRIQLAEDKVTLVISTAMVVDAGRYNCRVVPPQRPEMAGSVHLTVLAPPTAPHLFLRVPQDPKVEKWRLLCTTKGFYPAQLTLRWTWRTTGAQDPPESVSCPLKAGNREIDQFQTPAGNSESARSHTNSTVSIITLQLHDCVSGPDGGGPEIHLTSQLTLPSRRSISAGITFTCTVEDHPALETPLSASFNLESTPNEVIGCLNIIKIVVLSGICVLIVTLEIVYLCERRPKYSKMKGPPSC